MCRLFKCSSIRSCFWIIDFFVPQHHFLQWSCQKRRNQRRSCWLWIGRKEIWGHRYRSDWKQSSEYRTGFWLWSLCIFKNSQRSYRSAVCKPGRSFICLWHYFTACTIKWRYKGSDQRRQHCTDEARSSSDQYSKRTCCWQWSTGRSTQQW